MLHRNSKSSDEKKSFLKTDKRLGASKPCEKLDSNTASYKYRHWETHIIVKKWDCEICETWLKFCETQCYLKDHLPPFSRHHPEWRLPQSSEVQSSFLIVRGASVSTKQTAQKTAWNGSKFLWKSNIGMNIAVENNDKNFKSVKLHTAAETSTLPFLKDKNIFIGSISAPFLVYYQLQDC